MNVEWEGYIVSKNASFPNSFAVSEFLKFWVQESLHDIKCDLLYFDIINELSCFRLAKIMQKGSSFDVFFIS